MSPWAPESASPKADSIEAPPAPSVGRPRLPASTPWWAKLFPFFTSALFFVSAVFLLLSPLPLLFTYFKQGRRWAMLASVTNTAIVFLIAGRVSVAVFLTLTIVPTIALAEFLLRFKKPEKAVLCTLGTMVVSAAAFVLVYAQLHHVNPWAGLHGEVTKFVDAVGKSVTTGGLKEIQPPMTEPELQELKDNLEAQFPSSVAIFALFLVWTNLVITLRLNPGGIREKLGLEASFFRRWKVPELLVWPTIVAGFFRVVEVPQISDIALNVFYFFLAIYYLQGLSILSFFFDVWRLRGLFRVLGFVIAGALMTPLVLSLGFFDLWFDFRSKFRQS